MRELIKLVSTAGTGYYYTTDKRTGCRQTRKEVRPDCSQACALQRSEDQVTYDGRLSHRLFDHEALAGVDPSGSFIVLRAK